MKNKNKPIPTFRKYRLTWYSDRWRHNTFYSVFDLFNFMLYHLNTGEIRTASIIIKE